MRKFAKGFLVGAATAAHQVEGNNIHSDDWALEQMPYSSFVEPSGEAVDHYHRYEEDIELMANAGLNAYRFSIEWARIEPEQGRFDESEIEHYRKVLECCEAHGLTPIVTMMHFTSPVWVIRKGGWENPQVADWFAAYCRYVVEQLGDHLHYVCTINEANMRLQLAAIMERYKKMMMAKMAAPQSPDGNGHEQDAAAAADAAKKQEGTVQVGLNLNNPMERMKLAAMEQVKIFGTPQPATFVSGCTDEGDILVMKAHQAAKEAMKEVKPDLEIGLTLSLHDMQCEPGGEEIARREWDAEFTHYIPYIRDDDFFGVQNYTRAIYGPNGSLPVPEGNPTTQMDYEDYPEALGHVIRRVHEELPDMDLMVTENGIATADDTQRQTFINKAIAGVQGCIAEGIPVKGYMYWSLMDNFEWQKGFAMQFGLIAVDRSNMKRNPKPSLALLGSCAAD